MAEAAPTGRAGTESLNLPNSCHTVNDVHHWLALTAAALVDASAYDDRAEVAWFFTDDPA